MNMNNERKHSFSDVCDLGEFQPHWGNFVHTQWKEKDKKDVQTSRKLNAFWKTECELFQRKCGTPGVNSAVGNCKPDRHMLYFRKLNSGPTNLTLKVLSFHSLSVISKEMVRYSWDIFKCHFGPLLSSKSLKQGHIRSSQWSQHL